ncbi:hybrid sensor histidine kinase/response regulator [Oleidesulfovibrio alaskensis]|uniref:hybrid sensor histidine kinase/response regulator n=1 Tax=Oleidesulfovibrio alaskensis TaxID=58180 RepID=UPI001A50664F|nr:ATP-binding protein [Oleidesulfovibrio alaskensis]MBL3582263.1 response regulator [Oleidesulfovibrio alaskensis]
MNRTPLKRRFTVTLMLFTLLCCALYTVTASSFMHYHNAQITSRTERLLHALVLQRENDLANQIFVGHIRALRSTAADLQETDDVYSITVYDKSGKPLIHTRPERPLPLTGAEMAILAQGDVDARGTENGVPLLYHTSALMVIGELQGFVTVAYDLSHVRRDTILLSAMLTILLLGTVIATGMVCSHFITQHIRRPLTALRDAMHRARSGELQHRAPIEAQDEVGRLAESFNAMVATLQRNESSLRHAQTIYRDIFENALEGIFQITGRGYLINANPALARMLGYSSVMELLAERGTTPLKSLVNRRDLARMLRMLRAKGAVDGYETRVYTKGGGITWISVSARTIAKEETGQPESFRYEGFVKDITEHRRLRELEQTRTAMIEADKAKSDFLAHMSHEIRTPMNSVLGMAEQMLRTPLSAEQKECMDVLKNSGESLLHLINDILDLTRVEGGQLALASAPFTLHAVVYGVRDMLSLQARQKNILLAATIAPDVRKNHMGDAQRLQQILVNLLGNAVKFTDNGEVSLHVSRAPDAVHDGELLFTVRDTGIGITPAEQSRLFQKFSQASTAIHSRYGGSGLGLAISRHLVDLMGGTIRLESEPGVGTTVTFTTRFAAVPEETARTGHEAEQPDTAGDDATALPALTVLLAEDTPSNRAVVRMMLQDTPCTVIEAEDGQQALHLFGQYDIDVVLMDINMPVMDGMEATRQLRRQEHGSGRRTPVIALTANAFQQDIIRYRQAGCDGHLVKPVTRKALLTALQSCAGSGATHSGSGA